MAPWSGSWSPACALQLPQARAKRPAEAEDRIIGANLSAIGTLVERTSRFTVLIHLPRLDGYGLQPRVKNGPTLAGYGAEPMEEALKRWLTALPEPLRKSLP